MKQERQLRRNISGTTYYCEVIRGLKEDAIKSKNIQKSAGFKARVYPVSVEGKTFYGVFVS